MACQLAGRRKGKSYREISALLGIAKSTVSLWLLDTPVTNEQRNILNINRAKHLNNGPNSQKNRREREVNNIIRLAKLQISENITLETFRLFGTALFWAEGGKNKMFNLTNSDPHLILFWVKWLEKIFNISPKTLVARMNIYPQQSEKHIINFWSELTKIPSVNFGKSFIKPLSTNYKKNNLYYGTIRIEVPKGTNFRYMVYAWKEKILEKIAPEVTLIERKWEKLRKVAKPQEMK